MKEIPVPILNSEYKVIVIIGNNNDLGKISKLWGYEDFTIPLGERRGSTYNGSGLNPIIHLLKKPKTATEIGTLAHEAVHAINHIFDKIEDMDRNTEVFAHSVGAVVRTVLKTGGNK